MTRKELEEVAVDGMFNAEQWSSFWSREDAAALFHAALSAIEGAGFAVVPVVPDDAMVRAATALAPTWDDETSRRKWSAMLLASKV